jgi:DNA-binding MarR family transcriptional regulator
MCKEHHSMTSHATSPDGPPPEGDAASPAAQAPEHALLALERFLPYRLSVLSNRISHAISGIYSDRFGLGVTEWRVMAVLGRFPGLSANEVAERTAMDKVAVSRAVAKLIDSGRLDRQIHGNDRRRSVLTLSEEGYRIYDAVAPTALAFEARLLEEFDADDRALLFRLLDRLDADEVRAEAGLAAMATADARLSATDEDA